MSDISATEAGRILRNRIPASFRRSLTGTSAQPTTPSFDPPPVRLGEVIGCAIGGVGHWIVQLALIIVRLLISAYIRRKYTRDYVALINLLIDLHESEQHRLFRAELDTEKVSIRIKETARYASSLVLMKGFTELHIVLVILLR